MIPFYFFLTLLGLLIGSFLGMLTYRLPRSLSFGGRSFCDNCKKKIFWYENIPVFSYIFLHGKCAGCKKKISVRYPLIEIVTAFSFLSVGLWQNSSFGNFNLLILLSITSLFVVHIVVDVEFQILPDIITYILGGITLIILLALPSPILFQRVLCGAVVGAFFLFVYLLTKGRGMGFGDVKLSLVLGGLLGYPLSMVWLFMAFLTGAVIGLILLVSRKAKFGRPIPFGPFLAITCWLTIFFGDKILRLYIGVL